MTHAEIVDAAEARAAVDSAARVARVARKTGDVLRTKHDALYDVLEVDSGTLSLRSHRTGYTVAVSSHITNDWTVVK